MILKDKPDKQCIESQIKILKDKEICKIQRSSSSSTTVTNAVHIENKFSKDDNKGNNSIENDIMDKFNNINNNLFSVDSKDKEMEFTKKKESYALPDSYPGVIIQNENLNDSFEKIKNEIFDKEEKISQKDFSEIILFFFQRQNRFNDIM